MAENISKKEIFFSSSLDNHQIQNQNVATFETNFRGPVSLVIQSDAINEGTQQANVYISDRIFIFPSRVIPVQKGSGDPSPMNKRPINPGFSIVRDDGSILDIYDGTLIIHDDDTWTVTRSTECYHPNGNEPRYSKTGSQVLFELPSRYKVTSYNYHACSDFPNTVAHNQYAYIRTEFTVLELQSYFRNNHVDLLLPLRTTETYDISLSEVKKTLVLMSSTGRMKSISVPVDGEMITIPGLLMTYFGRNNVWCDIGKIANLTYQSQNELDNMSWKRDSALQLRRRMLLATI